MVRGDTAFVDGAKPGAPLNIPIGVPMTGNVLAEVSMFSIAWLMIGGLGEDAVASQVAQSLLARSARPP
jgi:hypothetical protein